MIWKPSKRPPTWLSHSAKGSEWEEHKYVEEVDGKYYYPDSYEGGRHISDLKGSSKDTSKKDSNRSERADWSEGDSDFDEKNYNDKNRLGDTDFYGFTNKDGKNVILMEDKKWTLPEGVKLDAKLKKRLEKVSAEIEKRRENGENVTGDEWNKLVDDAIDGIESKSKSKSSKSSSKSSSKKGSKSGKSERQLDKERRAKNKATLAKRDLEKYRELVKERDKEYKRKTPRYMRHSAIWAPTPPEHIWR